MAQSRLSPDTVDMRRPPPITSLVRRRSERHYVADRRQIRKDQLIMKRLIVHIGWEKTGTTSLQAFMSKNAKNLEKSGIFYPNDHYLTFVQGIGHFPLAGAILQQGASREFIASEKLIDGKIILTDFTSYLRDIKQTVVISCEHLSSRISSDQEIRLLKESIDEASYEAKIVCYVRDPINLAISSYSTAVKGGRRERLDWSNVAPQNEYFNPLHRLRKWASVFGKDNLIVREYHSDKLINGNIYEDFSRLIQVDPGDFEAPERLNTALPPDRCEILRRCNKFLPIHSEDLTSWRKNTLARRLLRDASPERESNDLSVPVPVGVIDRFADTCREIETEFLSEGLSESWFRASRAPENVVDASAPEIDSDLISLSAEWLACLAKNAQELHQGRDKAIAERDNAIAERDKAIAERDKAIAERDRARRHPWKYLKNAASLRLHHK